MTNKNQIELANFIKSVHDKLRSDTKEKGFDSAWKQHLRDEKNLEKYSTAMRELAELWEENSIESSDSHLKKVAQSRIKWISENILSYFYQDLEKLRQKEKHLLSMWYDEELQISNDDSYDKINVFDVGSCYNPFRRVSEFKITAIDLYPNKELDVLKCDFLNVQTASNICFHDGGELEIIRLPCKYFDCVVFSLFLEYIPTSIQRIECCKKVYELLKPEGVLIIVTPDSGHVGKNARLMKNWRYTLGVLGFLRIKFEKLHHLTCMVYRKAIDIRISQHWSNLHKEDYMTLDLQIPQDKKNDEIKL